MKIHLYNYSLPVIFEHCTEALKEMNYRILHSNLKGNYVSAINGEEFCALSGLIDLKFSEHKAGVDIAIISSTLSNVFGIFYYDSKGEQEFVECFLDRLVRMKFEPSQRFEYSDYPEVLLAS